MSAFDVFFYIFGLLTFIGGVVTVFNRNIVYAAFSLLFAFVGVAGVYILLGADFLAITQLIVYVGGVLVLLVFGIMLTSGVMKPVERPVRQRLGSLGIAAVLCVALILVVLSTTWITHGDQPWTGSAWKSDYMVQVMEGQTLISGIPEASSGTSRELGTLLMTDYLLPFELISILLLVALIGAAYLARPQAKKALSRLKGEVIAVQQIEEVEL